MVGDWVYVGFLCVWVGFDCCVGIVWFMLCVCLACEYFWGYLLYFWLGCSVVGLFCGVLIVCVVWCVKVWGVAGDVCVWIWWKCDVRNVGVVLGVVLACVNSGVVYWWVGFFVLVIVRVSGWCCVWCVLCLGGCWIDVFYVGIYLFLVYDVVLVLVGLCCRVFSNVVVGNWLWFCCWVGYCCLVCVWWCGLCWCWWWGRLCVRCCVGYCWDWIVRVV